MSDNPLHKSVAPSKAMANPLMSPDGPGPTHGTDYFANSFVRPAEKDENAPTVRVRAIQRGLHADRVHDAGEEFDCSCQHVALTLEAAPGVGWMEPVKPAELVTLAVYRARKSLNVIATADLSDPPPEAA